MAHIISALKRQRQTVDFCDPDQPGIQGDPVQNQRRKKKKKKYHFRYIGISARNLSKTTYVLTIFYSWFQGMGFSALARLRQDDCNEF